MFERSAIKVMENSNRELKHTGNPDFVVNKVKQGLMYVVSGEGYMGNYKNTYKVVLVTDKFVYSKNIKSGYTYIRSHKEIDRIKSFGDFSTVGL